MALYRDLAKDDPLAVGYVAFPSGLEDEYFQELTAERRVPVKRAGFTVYRWIKDDRQDNEALDTLVRPPAPPSSSASTECRTWAGRGSRPNARRRMELRRRIWKICSVLHQTTAAVSLYAWRRRAKNHSQTCCRGDPQWPFNDITIGETGRISAMGIPWYRRGDYPRIRKSWPMVKGSPKPMTIGCTERKR